MRKEGLESPILTGQIEVQVGQRKTTPNRHSELEQIVWRNRVSEGEQREDI